MRYRKGAISDVLWLMVFLTCGLVLLLMQMSLHSTATIDAYVKNIVNEQVSVFSANMAGYSESSSLCNMYNESGRKLDNSQVFDKKTECENKLKAAITNDINQIYNKEPGKPFDDTIRLDSIDISYTKSDKLTYVEVTVSYKVNISIFEGRQGGFLKKTNTRDNGGISRKVSVTRPIENISAFAKV